MHKTTLALPTSAFCSHAGKLPRLSVVPGDVQRGTRLSKLPGGGGGNGTVTDATL